MCVDIGMPCTDVDATHKDLLINSHSTHYSEYDESGECSSEFSRHIRFEKKKRFMNSTAKIFLLLLKSKCDNTEVYINSR